jgi:hypothetical protein
MDTYSFSLSLASPPREGENWKIRDLKTKKIQLNNSFLSLELRNSSECFFADNGGGQQLVCVVCVCVCYQNEHKLRSSSVSLSLTRFTK